MEKTDHSLQAINNSYRYFRINLISFYMNILFVLKNDALLEELKNIIEVLNLEWEIFIPNDLEQCIEIYERTRIDIMLINFADEENYKILEEIIDRNPLLRTLTISNDLSCSDKNGCEDCVSNFNRKRLLLPIAPKVLYDTIENFDGIKCEYFKKFENVVEILPKVLERFRSYKYDEKNKLIYNNDKLSSYIRAEFVQILTLLDTFNIEYKLLDDNNIQILI